MGRRTALLLLAVISTTLTAAEAQEPGPAIGKWSGCFQMAQDSGRSACGNILLDSVRVCGHMANAEYQIPFDSLNLPAGMQIQNQGTFSWNYVVARSRVGFYSGTSPAETPDGEPVCVMGTRYFEAIGSIEGDSLTGFWDWGGREGKRIGGTFRLRRSP